MKSIQLPRRSRLFITAPAFLLAGCSAIQAARNEEMDKVLVTGDYKAVALMAESRMGLSPLPDNTLPPVVFQPTNVLNHLDAGACWLPAGDPDRSILHFDAAESALKDVETQGVFSSGSKMVGASLLNESVMDYVPSPAESVLINYYKAIDFLKKGDAENARVELNRSGDRTRRAVERYSTEIAEAEAKASGKSAGQSYSNDKVKTGVDAQFPEMAQWAPYKEFIVPPAAYLQALFLGRSKDSDDRNKSIDLYNRIVGLVDANEAVAQDATEASSGRVCPKNRCVWVMIEHGLGPELTERRFDLPIVTPSGLLAVSLALPKLESRTSGDELPIRVSLDSAPIKVPLMGSMDRVVQSEFQKRFPGIVTRAVISSTAKAIAQNEINRNAGNPLLGLAMNVASIASTGADLRSWRSMPGRWSLARIDNAAPRKLTFESLAGSVDVDVPTDGSYLVYVKAVSNTAKPIVDVLPI